MMQANMLSEEILKAVKITYARQLHMTLSPHYQQHLKKVHKLSLEIGPRHPKS